MPCPAGVAGGAHPQRNVNRLRASQTTEQEPVILFGELGQLIEGDVLVLARSVAKLVGRRLQVAEGQGRRRAGGWKLPRQLCFVPHGVTLREPLLTARNQPAGQLQSLRVLPQDQRRIARHVHVLQSGHEQRFALPATRGAAVKRLAAIERQERLLLRGRIMRKKVPPLAASPGDVRRSRSDGSREQLKNPVPLGVARAVQQFAQPLLRHVRQG